MKDCTRTTRATPAGVPSDLSLRVLERLMRQERAAMKHTSTEAHMSKVEVKQQGGDSWRVRGEALYQIRGRRSRLVVNSFTRIEVTTWIDEHPIDAQNIPDFVAHDWIAKCGGTVVEWAEIAEEKKPKIAVAHERLNADGIVVLSVEGSLTCLSRDEDQTTYRRITIAGVP